MAMDYEKIHAEELAKERAYRKENFQVQIEPSKFRSYSDFLISFTRNGSHWQSFDLYASEIDTVIAALQEAKAANGKLIVRKP